MEKKKVEPFVVISTTILANKQQIRYIRKTLKKIYKYKNVEVNVFWLNTYQ